MWKTMGRHSLCVCLLVILLSWAEDTKEEATDDNYSVGSQRKHRQLFTRRRTSPLQGSQLPGAQAGGPNSRQGWRQGVQEEQGFTGGLRNAQKVKPVAMTPARRCSRQMENCSSHVPCCDPCASCRCRLFNTICNCWRIGLKCSKRT